MQPSVPMLQTRAIRHTQNTAVKLERETGRQGRENANRGGTQVATSDQPGKVRVDFVESLPLAAALVAEHVVLAFGVAAFEKSGRNTTEKRCA